MTKGFVVHYSSPSNIFSGAKFFKAKNVSTAQDLFFTWLKAQDVYQHLWKLSIEIEEVEL